VIPIANAFRWLVRTALWLLLLPIRAVRWSTWFLVGSTGALLVLAWETVASWTADWGEWWQVGTTRPWVVEHTIPLAFPFRDLTKVKFNRLLFVMLVEEATAGRLLTCWQDEAAYGDEQARFTAELGRLAGATPPILAWQGTHREAQTPSPWWQRHATVGWALVVTVVALLGYLQTVWDFATTTFVGPSADVAAVRRTVDVLDKDEFEVEFEVRNTSSYATSAVTFGDVELKKFQGPAGSEPIPIASGELRLVHRQPLPFSSLKPSASEKVKITGKAHVPGYYSIGLTGRATVPFLRVRQSELSIRKEEPIPDVDYQPADEQVLLHVWPRRTIGKKQVILVGKSQQANDRCQMKCAFMVGEEFSKGFDVEVSLAREPDVSFFDLIQFPGNPLAQSTNVDTKGKEITQLNWQAKDLATKTPYEFVVHLFDRKKQKRSLPEWNQIGEKLTVRFSYATPVTLKSTP
jgi:hypothetical protein